MSNRRKLGRHLTNAEVFERVGQFVRTGDPGHLPPGLRDEAEGIFAWAVEGARKILREGPPQWPASVPHPDMRPDATLSQQVRALMGDRADEDSGFTDDDGPEGGQP